MLSLSRKPLKTCIASAKYTFSYFNSKLAHSVKEIKITRKITADDVKHFSDLTGDSNPVHSKIVHGALLNGIVSGVIGTKLPGPGTIVLSQDLHFPNPCYVGSTVQISVILTEIRKIIKCKYTCINEEDKIVLHGEARLMIMKSD